VIATQYLAATLQYLCWVALVLIAPIGLAQAPAAALKVPEPTIFPGPGTYSNTTSLSLMDREPDARIHYTLDGKPARAGVPREITYRGGTREVPIVVTAHDGKSKETYRLTLSQ
jgi:hypothetical protein